MAGYCSRRQASRLIDDEKVSVNGELAGHLTFVSSNDQIVVEGKLLAVSSNLQYIIYHKPVGIDCNLQADDPDSLLHVISQLTTQRLFPVGRLDKDSCGLLLLTNDGALTNQLLSPEFKQPKCYQVTVSPSFYNRQQGNSKLTEDFIAQMNKPITIKGKQTLPCDITLIDDLSFEISLTQGLNRQIRRMCSHLGFTVTHLKRISFSGVMLGDLKESESRALISEEVDKLKIITTS